jgi:hypothetical protein
MSNRCGSCFSSESSPCIDSTLSELFIPAADLSAVCSGDLKELLFALQSDCGSSIDFISSLRICFRGANIFTSTCQYVPSRVHQYSHRDPNGILPEVLSRLNWIVQVVFKDFHFSHTQEIIAEILDWLVFVFALQTNRLTEFVEFF